MEEMVTVSNQTPIEIALNIDSDGMTTAKELFAFLNFNPAHYSRWIRRNITGNSFAEEGVDYEVFTRPGENSQNGGRPTIDYKLTAHFAKKLSMKGEGEKAEQAREYFAMVEEKAKEKAVLDKRNEHEDFHKLVDSVTKLANDTSELTRKVIDLLNNQQRIDENKTSFSMEVSPSWYDMYKDDLFYYCRLSGNTMKYAVHKILRFLSKYGFENAKKKYLLEVGKPEYELEVIDYFPVLKEHATAYLKEMIHLEESASMKSSSWIDDDTQLSWLRELEA